MMKTTALAALLVLLYTTAHAQDPVKISPQYYKVLLENDQVRVLEFRLKPGEKEPMHSHPAGIVYALGGATLKFTYADGRARKRERVRLATGSGANASRMRSRTSAKRKRMSS